MLSITDQIIATVNGLTEMRVTLLAKESIADKEISHHYHVLEMITMSAPQVSKVTKSLRTLLRDRRDIKESLAILNSTISGNSDIIARRAKIVNGYRNEAKASFNRIMGIMK